MAIVKDRGHGFLQLAAQGRRRARSHQRLLERFFDPAAQCDLAIDEWIIGRNGDLGLTAEQLLVGAEPAGKIDIEGVAP
jgi:hypothetical protein